MSIAFLVCAFRLGASLSLSILLPLCFFTNRDGHRVHKGNHLCWGLATSRRFNSLRQSQNVVISRLTLCRGIYLFWVLTKRDSSLRWDETHDPLLPQTVKSDAYPPFVTRLLQFRSTYSVPAIPPHFISSSKEGSSLPNASVTVNYLSRYIAGLFT